MCGFLEIRLEKNEKKKVKNNVGHRPTDRSIDRSSRRFFFAFFFSFFSLSCLCFWSTRTSIRAIILFLVILLTERRERGWQRQSLGRNDGSDQRYERLFCFESIVFILKKRNVYPLFSRLFYHLSPNRSLFYT